MARERITEEFVRHFRHLVERTGDDPSLVMRSLDRHPELAASLERLHEILEQVEHHRRFSNRRFIVQAHPEFPVALSEFRERWLGSYAYRRDWSVTVKDFVRHHHMLVEQTENRPGAVRHALDKNPDLADSIQRLNEIQKIVTSNSRSAYIFQAYPEFHAAFTDFQENWPNAWKDHFEWVFASIDYSLDGPPDPPVVEAGPRNYPPEEHRSHFDPDRDSIAMVMKEVEDYIDCSSDYIDHVLEEPSAERWAWGLAWLRETVGLNFQELETRWNEFPDFIVPKHVSDEYNPDDQYFGLYGYLRQIRRAYIIGADLAAVALCRATTELLIRFHYATDVPNAGDSLKTRLAPLIRHVEKREEFEFLRKFNLNVRVDEANRIMHDARTGGSTLDTLPPPRNLARGLVIVWVSVLNEMVTKAPPPAMTG